MKTQQSGHTLQRSKIKVVKIPPLQYSRASSSDWWTKMAGTTNGGRPLWLWVGLATLCVQG